MSATIWTRCGGTEAIGPIQAAATRVVESQHRSASRRLCASDDDLDLLEQLIETAKPTPVPAPGYPAFDLDALHWLLRTPFRYRPPLQSGSRFGSAMDPPVWYGSEHIRTALAERSFHFLRELQRSAVQAMPRGLEWTDYRIPLRSDHAIDLTAERFDRCRKTLESPDRYASTQQLGRDLRDAHVVLARYRSVRDPGPGPGHNVAVFHPVGFAARSPSSTRDWAVVVEPDRLRIERKALTRPARPDHRYVFSVDDFETHGHLPDPAG